MDELDASQTDAASVAVGKKVDEFEACVGDLMDEIYSYER